MLTLFLTTILLTSSNAQSALSPEREKCIRCICNAVSACFSLTSCAEKNINLNYWLEAGSPVVEDNANDINEVAYSKCIQNDKCILTTIDQYTTRTTAFTNDINCDGIVDCKDHLAVHKFGRAAKKEKNTFTRAETRRYDICTGENLTDSSWRPGLCIGLRINFR